MELLTKQGLQLTFLKVNVKAYFGSCELLITFFVLEKLCQNSKNISQPIFTNITSVLSPAYFLPWHTTLSKQNSRGI